MSAVASLGSQGGPRTIQFKVATGASTVLALEFPPETTVEEIKEELFAQTNMAVIDQQLFLGPNVLRDTQRLSEVAAGRSLPLIKMVKASKNWVVSAGMDGDGNSPHKEYALHLWDMDQNEIIKSLKGFREPVRCLEVDWPSRRVLTGSEDGMLQLSHLFQGKSIQELSGHRNAVWALAVHWPTLTACSASGDCTLRVWHMKRERSTSTVLTGHHSTVWCVSVDWDNQLALSGSGDCTLRLWDIQQRSTVRVLRGHKSIVWCLAVNWEPQHRMAVSGADDHTIRLWDLDRGECLHVFKGHKCAVQCLSVDWARMRVLSGSEDKTLRVWYLDRKAFLQELNPAQGGSPGTIPVPHADTVWCVAADWCSQTAISGSGDGSLRLWDLETGFCLKQWRGHSSLVQCVSFWRA